MHDLPRDYGWSPITKRKETAYESRKDLSDFSSPPGRVDRFRERGGTLREGKRPLVIEGLWGIAFGHGEGSNSGPSNTLFFTAGPDDEENGYFGKIEVAQ